MGGPGPGPVQRDHSSVYGSGGQHLNLLNFRPLNVQTLQRGSGGLTFPRSHSDILGIPFSGIPYYLAPLLVILPSLSFCIRHM